MNSISQVYRHACRQIDLPNDEKKMFLKLLREISVNAVRRQKAWHVKEDFIALWFVSAGRYPGLVLTPNGQIIVDWVSRHLPFELNDEDKQLMLS